MLNNIVTYCKNSYDELAHKTTWPTRQELTHSAIIVLVASLVLALLVAGMDWVFRTIMELIYSV
ncbi:preprotein translocase subunit SecE [Alloprevotella rava]|uniref:Protein translocase subunit SecE n=1 Tax=Alloprevotella rava TaxID=671218 RepID=A0A7W5UIW8_9BACT|nr:preprotein translocase subunit SecE [Alloprevotella rava]MBB3703381.1 preprotein translocase subunit SecE [Alloprevotella rava]